MGATIGRVGGAVTKGGGIGRRGAVASGSGGPTAGASGQGRSVERVSIKRESAEDTRVLGGSEALGSGSGSGGSEETEVRADSQICDPDWTPERGTPPSNGSD